MDQYIWLGLLVFFGVLEAVTVGLTSIWFALGALVALLATSFGAALWLQVLAFILTSALALIGLRPLTKKYINTKSIATNADRVIGKIGIVKETVDNMAGAGTVSVGGKLWTARSDSGAVIEKGARVEILRIEGVKLIVSRREEPAD